MNRAGYAQETCRLFEAFGANGGNLKQFAAQIESSVFVSVFDDAGSRLAIQARYVTQQVFAGRVQVYAYRIDAMYHRLIQGFFQHLLIDVVLVLANPYGFGIDFDQLGQGIA